MKIGNPKIDLSHNGKIVCISIEAVDEATAKSLYEDFASRFSAGDVSIRMTCSGVEVEEISVN